MTDETSAAQSAQDPPREPRVETVAATDADLLVPPPDSPPIPVEPTSDPAGVLAVPDLAATGVTGPLVDVTEEGDTAFVAEALDEETLHFGEPAPAPVVCQWCNAPLEDALAAVCPQCGGRLQPVNEDIVVPGVTTLPAEALEVELRLRRRIADAAASTSARALGDTPVVPTGPVVVPPVEDGSPVFRPPSDEVARLMREMELDARMAQLEREVPDEVLEQVEAAAAAGGTGPFVPGASPVADDLAVPTAVSDDGAVVATDPDIDSTAADTHPRGAPGNEPGDRPTDAGS